MSRWTKSIVVPLDSLCKEKENTNRPTVARSVGTVGKWGKMGFTSTRTYALSVLPASMAAAAAAHAASIASPAQSPASPLDDSLSLSIPEPPKPKKFFKSRNTAPPEVIAQMMQQLPQRVSTSPTRDALSSAGGSATTMVMQDPPIKLKITKNNSVERKKKSPKKKLTSTPAATATGNASVTIASASGSECVESKTTPESKGKKKKELKPEAPPSRVLGRARKVVNYCEDDDDEDIKATKVRIADQITTVSASVTADTVSTSTSTAVVDVGTPHAASPTTLPPPVTPSSTAPKTPEHPPIVLRISKGTSRLVSTDSEEQPNSSPAQQHPDAGSTAAAAAAAAAANSRLTSIDEEEVPSIANVITAASSSTAVPVPSTPKIILRPPKPPPGFEADSTRSIFAGNPLTTVSTIVTRIGSTTSNHDLENEPPEECDEEEDNNEEEEEEEEEEPPEINYCTVKISPDKPPKERLKLIIKTDVIRNAIAKAAAAEKAKEAAAAGRAASAIASGGDESRSEKKSKSKKHKHLKHAVVDQLLPTSASASVSASATATATGTSEFKTPSPHLALSEHQQRTNTVVSPTTRSDHDFDSQSSVLGSISSKGNSTPQPLAQAVQEESCVIHSRGSSVITSDLETSQHSSLVAPPSDIESRLESMMMTMDGGGAVNETQQRIPAVDEPLQEDILAVLRGEEDVSGLAQAAQVKVNGAVTNSVVDNADELVDEVTTTKQKRVTRGRGRKATANNNGNNSEAKAEESAAIRAPTRTRGRGRNALVTSTATESTPAAVVASAADTSPSKRSTRRAAKKTEAELDQEMDADASQQDDTPARNRSTEEQIAADTLDLGEQLTSVSTRRGRIPRSYNNTVSSSNNNNNINKIAANLSAKATAAQQTAQRSYGRKRKNQQVTQVVAQPEPDLSDDDLLLTPAKLLHLDLDINLSTSLDNADCSNNSNNSSSTLLNDGSSSSPPRRDYKFKDKFKRTLTLDTQVGNNAQAAAASAEDLSPSIGAERSSGVNPGEEEQQRGAVKLLISKKKGSIFKSRTLVPSDQTEQATVTKRHLYKHSWDATLEANGAGNGSDGSNASPSNAASAKSNDGHATNKSAADAIYADFGDSNSTNNHSTSGTARGDSPSIGKLTRVIKPNPQAANAMSSNPFDLDDDDMGGSGASETNAGLRVDRKTKEYYTVVRNVKTAHQIQEIGEYQEMDDDVEYILDALQPHNPPATRCLSALQLATKCMTPAFRMHVRAHGVVTKFFKALSDANKDLSLGLCTSAIMYILSQEGLNMDLDRDSLELMMNLLEAEGVAASSDRANYERNKLKVRELCEEIKAQGKATHLNVDSITVGTLAMETLLSLTSKRAGDWFKEDLRKLGGLEHIIKTISEYCRPVLECCEVINEIEWTQSLLDNMQTVARCLRVLENVTQHNEANQRYMLTYADGTAVNTLCTLLRLCDRAMPLHPTTEDNQSKEHPGVVMRELLTPVMKVLINLTHTFNASQASLGASMLGARIDVIETSFHLLLLAPNYIPDRCVFELSILVLMLLINLTMYTLPNRAILVKAYAPPEYIAENPPLQSERAVTAIQAVIEYFYKCEELARLVEKNTDAFLENNEKTKKKQEEVEETVNNLMQRAGHHMEHTLKGSYAGILIGHLITDNEQFESIVRAHLRGHNFREIIGVLEKYHTFMNLTASSEAGVVAHIKSTKKLIDDFKKRDYIYENSDENPLPLNLEVTHHHDYHSQHHHHQQQQQYHHHHSHHHQHLHHQHSSQSAASSSSSGSASGSSSSGASNAHQHSNTETSSPTTSPTTRSSMPRVFKTYSHR